MPPAMPDATQRWRCSACGNLTRFDLVRTRRTREYVHLDLEGEPIAPSAPSGAGDPDGPDSGPAIEILSEDIAEVRCRWCSSTAVEVVPRPTSA